MRRPSLIAAISASVLAAAAGCGSSSPPSTSDFKTAFAAENAKLRALGTDVGTAVATARYKTDLTLGSEFRLLGERATTLAGDLGRLDAPKRYRSELLALQSSVTQVAGTLHSIQAAALAHDSASAKAGGEAIVADALQVKSNEAALSAKLGLPTSP